MILRLEAVRVRPFCRVVKGFCSRQGLPLGVLLGLGNGCPPACGLLAWGGGEPMEAIVRLPHCWEWLGGLFGAIWRASRAVLPASPPFGQGEDEKWLARHDE